jgi:hypothetical protein
MDLLHHYSLGQEVSVVWTVHMWQELELCEESHRARDCRKYPDVASKLNVIKEKKCILIVSVNTKYSRLSQPRDARTVTESITQPSISLITVVILVQKYLHSKGLKLQWFILQCINFDPVYCLRQQRLMFVTKYICISATIIFDEGAKRSFITETLTDKFQLPRENPKQSEYLRLGTEVIRCNTLIKLQCILLQT